MNLNHSYLILVLFLGLWSGSGTEAGTTGSGKVEPGFLVKVEEKGTLNIILSFRRNGLSQIRDEATSGLFVDVQERRSFLVGALKSYTESSQASVMEMLRAVPLVQKSQIHQFWVSNNIIVKGANAELVKKLMDLEDLLKIEEETYLELDRVVQSQERAIEELEDEQQWGVVAIDAPTVWDMGYRGEGIVVANIDSGVRGSHEALRDSFRENFGWFDPVEGTISPTDDHGHGTHTMGIIVGRSNGIGVAPGAQWIACKSCNNQGRCVVSDVLACGQWVLCPDPPACSHTPHLVSNSWGGIVENEIYEEMVENWLAAELLVLFASGNYGNTCNTAGTPGTHPGVISVGSTNVGGEVSYFSSRGPSVKYGRIKPDVAAPGAGIISAGHSSDEAYVEMDGTSMATPHVAGLVALLYSKRPGLSVEEVKAALFEGATAVEPSFEVCGGVSDEEYPNNHVGWGLVNATNSILAIDDLSPPPTTSTAETDTTDDDISTTTESPGTSELPTSSESPITTSSELSSTSEQNVGTSELTSTSENPSTTTAERSTTSDSDDTLITSDLPTTSDDTLITSDLPTSSSWSAPTTATSENPTIQTSSTTDESPPVSSTTFDPDISTTSDLLSTTGSSETYYLSKPNLYVLSLYVYFIFYNNF